MPFEAPPEVEYGGAPISNGCRTINGATPLGGSDKILKSAQAAFIYEINTETIIYSYNPDVRLYPGSLAKIMTALIAIEEGDMELAAQMLGRSFSIDFPVVHGDARGREMGFPTANQVFSDDFVLPRFGVYASKVTVDSVTYNAVTNVGIRPTFSPP